MKERVLAVFGALALIAAAFVVRSLIVGGDSGGGSGGPVNPSAQPVVACTNDLKAVCDALAEEGAIAQKPPTVELGSNEAKTGVVDQVTLDGWITWDPAPALANFDAGSSNPPWNGEVLVLSTDQLAVVGPADTLTGLQASCQATWACIADSSLKVGVGRVTTAEGIVRLSPLAVSLAEDLEPDTLDPRLSALRALTGGGQKTMAAQLRELNQPGFWDVVVGPKMFLDRAASTPQGQNRKLQVATPEPSSTISVVLATNARSERDLSGLLDEVRSDALSDAREAAGMASPPGVTVNEALAGFLYQVREKVG